MPDYVAYFLNSRSDVVQLELLEISHPAWSQTYRVVRNAVNGVTVTLETAAVVTFDYYPLKFERSESRDTLDYSFTVTLGDLGEVVPQELDAVAVADDFATKPTVIYRAYRSDDLTAPMVGPIRLEVSSFAFSREGCAFEAKVPSLNIVKTGEVYDLERFPMLRGFL